MYTVNQHVVIKITRCACVGGGTSEAIGVIIGIINDAHGDWYQVNTSAGVQYARDHQIVRVI